EILILVGLFKANKLVAALAIVGVILGAVYMLGMYQKVMLNKLDKPENKGLKDLNAREIITLLPVIFLILWIGLYPKPFLKLMSASTSHLVEVVRDKGLSVKRDTLAVSVKMGDKIDSISGRIQGEHR
ncbi:MAG: Fe-S-binding domain-containing protein, partial [Thermodesulfobacteriota bacterium]